MAAENWSAEVIDAVERWVATKREPSRESGAWRRIGTASPRGDGWLLLDLRDGRVNPESLGEPCFAGEHGPDHGPLYPVEELRNVDGVLELREPPNLPPRSRHVWARSMSQRFLLESLVKGLRSAGDAPLAQALAEKRLAGPPTSSAGAVGLLESQVEAYRACLSPGVRLVWGPPGTGKTQVLARAIEELVRDGKRVLLVSTANVAVDNALHAVLPRLPRRPGVAIRVGPAHLKEIATDPNVQLERLAATASRSVDVQRDRVAQKLREIDVVDGEVQSLRAELAGYDERTYRAAIARLATEREVATLRSRIREAEEAVVAAAAEDAEARAALDSATAARSALDPARRALATYQEAAAELARLDRNQRALQLERDALDLQQPGSWRVRRLQRQRRDRADDEVRDFVAEADRRRRSLRELQARALAIVGATSQHDLDDADLRATDAEAAAASAAEGLQRARLELDDLRRAADQVRSRGSPSTDDRRLVAWCSEHHLPARHARLRQLIARQRQVAGQRGALETQHRVLVDRARRLRADAEAEIVRGAQVVATTLARSRVHRAIAKARFDVVLVDEAGAAPLAEVLFALSRGTTTAVLFGDFLQLGPVLDTAVRTDPSPAVEKWVRATCFSHVGIEAPDDVARDGSCVALTHQFRFGPALRRLANDVIYEVLRDAHELRAVGRRPQTEIVLVDVSTVPDLAGIRAGSVSGKWWMAGVVLSRALAELHVAEGPVGVAAPYTVQSEATLAALRDRNLVTGTAVGTVHSFQGREYPTVVFDLVDDGHGWIARGRRDRGSWEDAGLKVFGVGITRARNRLYLIVDGRGIRSAVTGPLRELRRGLERGEIERWSAAVLLGVDDPPPGPVDSTFAEVSRLLQRLVTVTDVHDELTFGRELERHLSSASSSVWMWSPWVTNRAHRVVPLIRAAVARGVDVRVFIRPDEDRLMATPAAQRQLPGLVASGATVIRSDHEHRKIIVIDRQVVLLGSLNTLSHNPGSTRETMITMVGQVFADRLLAELRAVEIGTPRACSACGRTMDVRRRGGRSPELYWHCRPCDVQIPPHAGRNRPSRW